MQKSVLNYLNQIVREKPDKMAYSDGTEGMTFREVYRYSRSIGSFLHEKGIYKKPIVVFMRKSRHSSELSQGGVFMCPSMRRCLAAGFS